MPKYLVNHKDVSPENFLSVDDPQRKVKALALHRVGFPEIIYDDPQVIKNNFFTSLDHIHMIPLHPYFHMYIDQLDQIDSRIPNIIATYIYRHSLQTYIGINSVISINGGALIFGSVSSKDEDNFSVDYSVPYEVIEQVSRYFDYEITL